MNDFADFEVISVISAGASSTCYKVSDKNLLKTFIWKALDYNRCSDSQRELLISQISLLKCLKHPNLVQYFGHRVSKEGGTVYIITEFCEGEKLFELISKCRMKNLRFDESFIWKVIYQICKALQFFYNEIGSETTLQPDIKSENIFLDAEGNVKLGNILKFESNEKSLADYTNLEEHRVQKLDKNSDIWWLGCLIFELCTLELPPENISIARLKNIPVVFSNNLQHMLSFMVNVDPGFKPGVEVLLRHPMLMANLSDLDSLGFPRLIPKTEETLEDIHSSLSFNKISDSLSFSSTPTKDKKILTQPARTSSTPELSNTPRHPRRESLLTATSSKRIYDPIEVTENIFNQALVARLKSIRLQETMLKEKENDLKKKEDLLVKRERNLRTMEKAAREKLARAENVLKKRQNLDERKLRTKLRQLPNHRLDATYCSIEPNDTFLAQPTAVKLDPVTLNINKTFARKVVSFRSPQKITKYDIDPHPPRRPQSIISKCSRSSTDSEGKASKKSTSIFSFFKQTKKPSKEATDRRETTTTNETCEVITVTPTKVVSKWTTENKRAAFEMLAALNTTTEVLTTDTLLRTNHRRRSMIEPKSGPNMRI